MRPEPTDQQEHGLFGLDGLHESLVGEQVWNRLVINFQNKITGKESGGLRQAAFFNRGDYDAGGGADPELAGKVGGHLLNEQPSERMFE